MGKLTKLRLLPVDPGRPPLPQDEPTPQLAPAPEWLTPEAKEEWGRTGQRLLTAGLMTEADTPALLLYCEAWSTWRHAMAKVAEFGLVIKTKSAYLVPSPYLLIANKAMDQMLKILAEFGMTPSSRARVSTSKAAEDNDPIGELRDRAAKHASAAVALCD